MSKPGKKRPRRTVVEELPADWGKGPEVPELPFVAMHIAGLSRFVPALHKAANILASKKEMGLAATLREIAAALSLRSVRGKPCPTK